MSLQSSRGSTRARQGRRHQVTRAGRVKQPEGHMLMEAASTVPNGMIHRACLGQGTLIPLTLAPSPPIPQPDYSPYVTGHNASSPYSPTYPLSHAPQLPLSPVVQKAQLTRHIPPQFRRKFPFTATLPNMTQHECQPNPSPCVRPLRHVLETWHPLQRSPLGPSTALTYTPPGPPHTALCRACCKFHTRPQPQLRPEAEA